MFLNIKVWNPKVLNLRAWYPKVLNFKELNFNVLNLKVSALLPSVRVYF